MGSRCLLVRLRSSSSTWGRRILTEQNTGLFVFVVRSPFNARLEGNKNQGKRESTNKRLLIESRRYCHTTISPAPSDNPDSKKNSQKQKPKRGWVESEIAKLCKENKVSEAFELFRKNPTLFNARDLIEYYIVRDGSDAVNSALQVYDLLVKQLILPNQEIFSNLMLLCNRNYEFFTTFKLYHDMEKYHVPMNASCFDKIAFALYRQSDKTVAKKLLDVLKSGVDFVPFASSCSSLLSLNNSDDMMWIFDYMLKNNISFNKSCLIEFLKVCSSKGALALELGQKVHSELLKTEFKDDSLLLNYLLQMYAQCGDINKCIEVFETLKQSDVVLWNLIINLSADHLQPQKSIEIYDKMISNNVIPSQATFVTILTIISNLGPNALEKGKQIHQQITQHKFDIDTRVISTLIQMYNKCGEPHKSIEAYDQMIENNLIPNKFTFTNILTAISNLGPNALEKGKQIHQQITQQKIDLDINLTNSLIQMYNRCGEPNKSVEVYEQMVKDNLIPNKFTFTNILSAISNLGPHALERGKQIHQQITQHQLDSNIKLISSLIQMYDKCGEPSKSLELYTHLVSRVDIVENEITLLTVLNACAHLGEVMTTLKQKFKLLSHLRNFYYRNNEDEARKQVIEKFKQLQKSPQYLHAKESYAKAIETGKQIHQQITQHQDLSLNPLLTTSLMKMYTFCGEYEESEKLFDQLQIKDELLYHFVLITYSYRGSIALERGKQIHQQITQQSLELQHNIFVLNSLIQMYGKCGEPNKAVELFEQLVGDNITPTEYTYTHVFLAISYIGKSALEKGKSLHQSITSSSFSTKTFVLNALIEMYNKCGEPEKSLEIYDSMISNNIKLDEYTYRYTLDACLNLGPTALEKGKKIHQHLLENRVFE